MTNRLNLLTLSPTIINPSNSSKIQPGDLSQFAPYGNGCYGYEENSFHPIKGAPEQEAEGGFIYFENSIRKENFEGFLEMMRLGREAKDYVAFIQESSNPFQDKYLKQMRLVPKFALKYMFNTLDDKEYNSFKEQELTFREALWEFMESEKENWGTSFFNSPKLAGIMGGDGDWAREELSFGFMLENSYYHVARIWSRAWIVTK